MQKTLLRFLGGILGSFLGLILLGIFFFFKGNSFLLHNKVERCVTELPVCALLTFHMKKIPGSLLFAL